MIQLMELYSFSHNAYKREKVHQTNNAKSDADDWI